MEYLRPPVVLGRGASWVPGHQTPKASPERGSDVGATWRRGSAVERRIGLDLVGCLGGALEEGEHLGGERARPARRAGCLLELRHLGRWLG